MNSVETTRQVERVVGTGAADFDRVRSRVESLVRIDSPSLIVPSRVTMARGDQVAVTEPPHDNGTLRAVLDARGALKAGECVWLGTAVAEAIVLLHKEGLVHGALDAEAVVIDRGRVRLAKLVDGAKDAQVADDIAALGRMLASAVRESDADRIVAWTEPMTHPDPLGRPTAAMVVHALASCAPPEEVLLPAIGVASALRRAATSHPAAGARTAAVPLRESRWWRLRLEATRSAKRFGMVIAALGLLGGIGVGVGWATHLGPWANSDVDAGALPGESVAGGPGASFELAGASASAQPLQTPEDAGEQLTASRFDALSRGDGEALVALTVAGSPARADAAQTAIALQDGLLRVDGLVGSVEDSVRLGGAADESTNENRRAVVRVRYRLEPHAVVADGETTHYDGYEQTVDLTLEWGEGSGWLVSQVGTVPEADL